MSTKHDQEKFYILTLLDALSYIANEFMTPEEIRASDIGLSYEEHLEMSYENMQNVARDALIRVGVQGKL